MDFYKIRVRTIENGPNKGQMDLYPDFTVGRSKDLMVRGRAFYAIWDEDAGLWSTDEYDVQRLVDADLFAYADKHSDQVFHVKNLASFNSKSWTQFKMFVSNLSDNSHPLDMKLTFANTEVQKTDYVSRRLPYALAPGDYSSWDELVGTLYSVEQRAKIEWAIGAIVAGDASKIQKFLVLYGPAGTGKSTILNIVEKLFSGYTTTFEAKALGGNNNAFATEAFKHNPLVAIQHDGDLSRIEDNTKLNSVISHEEMTFNEKYKPSYTGRVNAFLFMGTNQPVKISDAKSGIIRRLINVEPTGIKIPINHFNTLIQKVDFELGAIAHHCLEVYRHMGKNYYNGYRPTEMMLQTDVFFNYIEANFDIFRAQDGVGLKQAYAMYKEFCAETGIEKLLPQHRFRDELRNYFEGFKERHEVDGEIIRSWYFNFNAEQYKAPTGEPNAFSLVIEESTSLLDDILKDQPAQLAKPDGNPQKYWTDRERLINGELKKPKPSQVCSTTLADIDTHQLHFVKLPENHVVIDFDLRGEDGEKSLERNLEAASLWPATYAELSRSGSGVHLHYHYSGDTEQLGSVYSEGIEVKVYRGDASLRRLLTKCNGVPVATIASGLPLKEKKMLQAQTIQSEKGLRAQIARNLRKEIHPGTKPSMDFIAHILEEAAEQGMAYDLRDMKPALLTFAMNSSNQSEACLKIFKNLKLHNGIAGDNEAPGNAVQTASIPKIHSMDDKEQRLALYDVEVYPNLFVVCWKYEGSPDVTRMINPTAQDMEKLFQLRLVGFYNRHYDNHILYGRYMGYDNKALFELSQKLINNDRHAEFGEAYNISYADIHDISSIKQSLKKFEIDLGILHMELDLPWDEPVPEEMWDKVVEYCANDVIATDAVLQDRRQDFVARQILAELSGLSVNDTTAKHTAKILFGNDRKPQDKFIYTDLSKEFPGYKFELGKSSYKGEDPSEGGYVYAEKGYHENVGLLDIASMHPTSMKALNIFGKEYTARFVDLLDARVAIKRGSGALKKDKPEEAEKFFNQARKMLDGKLAPFLHNVEDADKLAYSLKIIINIVYGLTSAKFSNPFKDHRNVDNIVAKRGALFMIDLKEAVQAKGWTVVHIKTDSIKIADISDEKIKFVTEFGARYGYEFEHEATYNKLVLVNDAVYVAQELTDEGPKYTTVGAQFQHPYVKKVLFTGEQIIFDDLCEARSVVKGAMYLDPVMGRELTKEQNLAEFVDEMHFIGRSGMFVPVREGVDGAGKLYRVNDGKAYAVAGTKGYFWMEASHAKVLESEDYVDMNYFDALAEEAKLAIETYTGFQAFVRDNKVADVPF
jgi:energy-coupling factor transporter ATP-binding protein EcfA2